MLPFTVLPYCVFFFIFFHYLFYCLYCGQIYDDDDDDDALSLGEKKRGRPRTAWIDNVTSWTYGTEAWRQHPESGQQICMENDDSQCGLASDGGRLKARRGKALSLRRTGTCILARSLKKLGPNRIRSGGRPIRINRIGWWISARCCPRGRIKVWVPMWKTIGAASFCMPGSLL